MRSLPIVVFVLFTPLSLANDPGSRVEFLMNEPATMFDLGMQRLPTETEILRAIYTPVNIDAALPVDVNWQYEPSDKEIVGTVSVFDSDSKLSAIESGCRRALTLLRTNVGKGLPFTFLSRSKRWASDDSEVLALNRELRELFAFSCVVYDRSTSEKRFEGAMRFDDDRMMLVSN